MRYRSRFEKNRLRPLAGFPSSGRSGVHRCSFVIPWQGQVFRMKHSLLLLRRILRHRPKIVLGMLEVILRRDLVSRHSFGAGQNQIALIVSLRALGVSRGTGGTQRLMFTGRLGSSRRRASDKLRIWAQPCRDRFRFRNLFHVGPYAAPAEAVRPSFEELSCCSTVEGTLQ